MLFLIWLTLLSTAFARRIIRATSLVPCMDNSGVQASKFDVTFTPDDRTLAFDVSLDVEVSGTVYADIVLYVYGFRAIHERIDPCKSSALQQLCPLSTGEIDIISQTQVSGSVVRDIPGVAYTVPNIDAFAIVKVYTNDTDELKACIRADVTNTKTVEQTAVKWVTACLCGAGILVSALLTYIGSSYTSQKIAATSTLLFTYFQSMAIVNMEAVDRVPPIANAWTENVVWSVGLVRATFMQDIFRWFVQSTGGHPATYLIYNTISVLTQRKRDLSNVPPRVADHYQFHEETKRLASAAAPVVTSLTKRANELAKETYAKPNHYLVVYRGIKRVGYSMGIEVTSIVLTSYTIYGFIVFCMVIIFLALWAFFGFMKRKPEVLEKHRHAAQYVPMLSMVLKGIMLKLIMFSFPGVIMFSMWEWVQQDSAAVIVLSVFFFICTLVILCWNVFQVLRIARRSSKETGTAAFLLYSHAPTMHRYGFLYHEYNSRFYYFGALNLLYQFVVLLFIAFSQSSGQTQGLAIFLIELAVLIVVCVYRPWMDRGLNIINILMQIVKTLNAMFYLFFSNLFTQPLEVNSIMGVVYFVLNAAFSCFLLIYIIVVCALMLFRRKHQEADAVNVRDDRMSFISDNVVRQEAAGELAALGQAAQADHEVGDDVDWYKSQENPFESGPLDSSYRNSQRTSTMNTSTSIPTFGDLQEGMFRHGHSESQTSFGLSGSDEKSDKKGKKWWVF